VGANAIILHSLIKSYLILYELIFKKRNRKIFMFTVPAHMQKVKTIGSPCIGLNDVKYDLLISSRSKYFNDFSIKKT
jgi:hypothetical protein